MKLLKTILSISSIILLFNAGANAATLEYMSPVDPTVPKLMKDNNSESIYSVTTQKAKLTRNDVHNHYEIAMQRFMQTNVKSAYKDFKMLIMNIVPNDYAYLRIAGEMAEIGLFDLSNDAINKATDREIATIQAEDIKKFYFPKNMLNSEDEIYLAEIYSNIMYNAQSKEATAELIKHNTLLEKYDYANYIVALGSLKANNYDDAEKYINKALKINPDNINYQKLKIEIVLQKNNNSEALKTLNNIKKSKLYTKDYLSKINSLEQYTLYKTEKDDVMKKYHLGYYYYDIGEYVKASRILQTAVTNKKKYNKLIYGLMSEVFYSQKEYEKAKSFAEKSLQQGGNDSFAMMVMGKVNYRNGDYKTALKNFKSVKNTSDNQPQVWLAMTYSALGNEKQAHEIYYKILKEKSDCADAYYNVGIKDKDREVEYYKKAVAANLGYIDGWAGLAKYYIDRNNLVTAGKYLEIVKYIDENDFRYYYYQGLVYKAKGMQQDAKYYFKKSLVINPNSELAKKELGLCQKTF